MNLTNVLRTTRAPRLVMAVMAAVLFAAVGGLHACGSNKPAAGAGTNTGGSTSSSGGTGGGGTAGGSGGASSILSDDDRLCADALAAQASVSCPDALGRYGRCKTAFAAGVCVPEVRATLRCASAVGAAAFECANGVTDLKKGTCESETNALTTCIFGASQKAQQNR